MVERLRRPQRMSGAGVRGLEVVDKEGSHWSALSLCEVGRGAFGGGSGDKMYPVMRLCGMARGEASDAATGLRRGREGVVGRGCLRRRRRDVANDTLTRHGAGRGQRRRDESEVRPAEARWRHAKVPRGPMGTKGSQSQGSREGGGTRCQLRPRRPVARAKPTRWERPEGVLHKVLLTWETTREDA